MNDTLYLNYTAYIDSPDTNSNDSYINQNLHTKAREGNVVMLSQWPHKGNKKAFTSFIYS